MAASGVKPLEPFFDQWEVLTKFKLPLGKKNIYLNKFLDPLIIFHFQFIYPAQYLQQ